MEEHRFCYPTVIPLQLGVTAHGSRGGSLGLGAAEVRSAVAGSLGSSAGAQLMAAESIRASTAAPLRPSTARSPGSYPNLRAARGARS
jgi:hypothetical protein